MLSAKEIRDMDDSSILAKVAELKRELFNLRMQKGASGLEKPHLVKSAKKDIARLLTVLNQRSEK